MKFITSQLHKLFGLYLIGAFTTFGLLGTANEVFAQGAGGGTLKFNDATKSAGLDIPGAGEDTGDSIIQVIKNFINYALGFLGLIALGMLIFGGYKMVASSGDEAVYKE
jgi:hypothetical protein